MGLKRILIIVALFVAFAIGAAAISFTRMAGSFEKGMKTLTIESIDFARVADGAYEGTCDLKAVSAKVRATVSGGRLTDLKILSHRHGPKYGGEAIVPRILEKQSLAVDALTGATSSGKIILKATEDALKKGLR